MTTASTTVSTLEPQALRQWMAEHEDLVIIDVRSAAEFESLHIRGSYNVPLPLLSELGDPSAWIARVGARA